MSDTTQTNTSIAKVNYILLIIGTIIIITGVIALIIAYVNKDDSGEWIQTHYRFQIRTCWIGLLYIAVAAITINIVIGYFILLFTFFWLVIRCAKGLKHLMNNKPVENVESWLFA